MEFQAETSKILDITARSLYKDREVFIREIVSNASDACEKARAAGVTGQEIADTLRIKLTTDDTSNTLIIEDSGVGMNEQELQDNLGSIGRSGTAAFAAEADTASAAEMIGQFGVGFYSTFMVASEVTVYTKRLGEAGPGHVWSSDGSGTYTIDTWSEGDAVEWTHGTRIVLKLRDNAKEFADATNVERILKQYSNFVGFELHLNGLQVNTVKPVWLLAEKDVTAEQNAEFYKFIAHAYDDPRYTFRYATDAPLSIRAIFYVGNMHSEKFGMGRMEPGVALFSRKVLIQRNAEGLLPEWLRFVKGVVDSEDVPLNISRETLQDQSLIRRLNVILTRRILRFLGEEAKKNPEAYNDFFNEFGNFLKEGICTDLSHKDDLVKLMRFESSGVKVDEVTTFEEYISRMPSTQKAIYYIIAPNRAAAESSPYYEGFRARNAEVFFCYSALDEFVMNNLSEISGKRLKSIEAAHDLDTELGPRQDTAKVAEAEDGESAADGASGASGASSSMGEKLTKEEIDGMCTWLKEALSERVSAVRTTDRLVDTPAIVVDHETASFRRMQRMVDPKHVPEIPKQQLEVNPDHPIVRKLAVLRSSNPAWAATIAEQVLDNALMAAGLLEDPRSIVPRINKILERAMVFNASSPAKRPTTRGKATSEAVEGEVL